jgi:hypothetical protein
MPRRGSTAVKFPGRRSARQHMRQPGQRLTSAGGRTGHHSLSLNSHSHTHMNIDETLAKLEAGLAETNERLQRLEAQLAEACEVFARYDARLALEQEVAEMKGSVMLEVDAPRVLNYENTRGLLVRMAEAQAAAAEDRMVAVCCPTCGAVGFPCDLPCAFCADAEEAPDKAA